MSRSDSNTTRVLLYLARRTKSRSITELAVLLAGDEDAEAVRYILLRYGILYLDEDSWQRLFFRLPGPGDPQQIGAILADGLRSDIKKEDLARLAASIRAADSAYETRRQLTAQVFEYAVAVLEARFVDAYYIWSRLRKPPLFSGAQSCEANDGLRSIAVVLPGTIDEDFSRDIDSHDFVGRTAYQYVPARIPIGAGSRMDYGFLNQSKFEEALRLGFGAEDKQDEPWLIAGERKHRTNRPAARIRCELKRPKYPSGPAIVPATLIIWRIVDWALDNGIRPTLFFADFYLGASLYADADYDSQDLLNERRKILLSYFSHDIFSVHAYLSQALATGAIEAAGKTRVILEWSTEDFANKLEEKWRD